MGADGQRVTLRVRKQYLLFANTGQRRNAEANHERWYTGCDLQRGPRLGV